MVGPTLDELRAAMADVVTFMERHGLPYAGDVRGALTELAAGDGHGARRYLALNRALLDIYFSPVNGNASSEAEGERLQTEWRWLHERTFTLADALLQPSR